MLIAINPMQAVDTENTGKDLISGLMDAMD
jgi:hypothetical protein